MNDYTRVGLEAWEWVRAHVQHDDEGPWLPEHGDVPAERHQYERGAHSGAVGLAHALAAVRATRGWTPAEEALAAAVIDLAAHRRVAEASFFDGLVGDYTALAVLGAPDDLLAARLAALADLRTEDGFPGADLDAERFAPGAVIGDATLGTAGVLAAAVDGVRRDLPAARGLATWCLERVLADAEAAPGGLRWRFVPARFRRTPATEMPNFSHGTAGVVAALAAAGAALGRPDAVTAAIAGAEHLLSLADPEVAARGGLALPHLVADPDAPAPASWNDEEPLCWGWCHGPAGTVAAFVTLARAGVERVGGEAAAHWERACLTALHDSGVPDRLRPGFWDNDGRCCGTAGVGEAVLDAWERHGDPRDLAFATRLGDALLDRAIRDQDGARWRFVEHRRDDPLLPPGLGWMQGAAGIAAYLLRLGRATDGVARRIPGR